MSTRLDMVEYYLNKGDLHGTSGGCIELMRDDIIWYVENVAIKKGTTIVVWTEKPATNKDAFESDALKDIMISRQLSDVSQLPPELAYLATPNK